MSDFGAIADKTILVVEDEYLIASDLNEAIQELGGTVLGPCPDPRQAREELASARTPPDAAILDINLNGRAVTSLAWELAELGVPLLYHTGYSTTPDAEGLPEGRLCIKPVDRPRLIHELSAVLRRPRSAA